jgi:hypothetical protein
MSDRPMNSVLLRARLRVLILTATAAALLLGCRSLKWNNPTSDKTEVRTTDGTPATAPPGVPSKYSFRVAPFVFMADFEVPRDQPLFQELAAMRDQITKELQLPPGNADVLVYLFEDRERYESYMKAAHPDLPLRRAFFIAQPRYIGGTEDLLVYTFWGEKIQQDLRHELTHALLHRVIYNVPIWLDEGLAEYYELPPERKGVNAGHLEALRHGPLGPSKPDLARLEGLTQVQQMTPVEYREAWAWVHLMLHDSPEAKTVLTSYLQQLRANNSSNTLGSRLAAVYSSPDEGFAKHLAQLDATARSDAPAPR